MDASTRIVILGKTGAGKSSLANTILGGGYFQVYQSAQSGTSKCAAKTASVHGRSISLIDTPGFFDTVRSEEELEPEIKRCIIECAPGPHVFLIVLKVEKFTEQEQEVVEKIQQHFSPQALEYSIVLFTHGDGLEDGWKIEDFVRGNEMLHNFVKACGGRCHVIDNKRWKNTNTGYRSNQFQVAELLKTVEKMIEKHEGRYLTNEMLQERERQIQEEEQRIQQSSPNMPPEAVREEAKSRVWEIWVPVGLALAALLIGLLAVKK